MNLIVKCYRIHLINFALVHSFCVMSEYIQLNCAHTKLTYVSMTFKLNASYYYL